MIEDAPTSPPLGKTRHQDRRCSASGDPLPPGSPALRFVHAPDGTLTFDLKGKLPGRGAWLTATRESLLSALKRGGFARSLRAQASLPEGLTPEDYAARVEEQLQRDALSRLGLCRKAGSLVIGADLVRKEAAKGLAYLSPSDASEAETTKLAAFLEKAHGVPHLPLPLARHPLSIALGQEGVHFLLLEGGPSKGALSALMLWRGFAA
ncbi:DUF448 domain-containing protein [Parvularcula maris]|uniref:DUF448 domain-containing protein n=1 Tax=Parvularcula maris TaxID=2965077 RepID=A0A9X2L661_9PROT|nr:DUF448 domain-containing protein [Parvularcula maris]MCQ8183792.1 DUF448 domain-containing protein [Parvularcula maris]